MASADINALASQIIALANQIIAAPTGTPEPPTESPPTTGPPPGCESGSFSMVLEPPGSVGLYIPHDAQSAASGYISAAEHGSAPDTKTLTLSLNGVVVATNTDNKPSIFVALAGQHPGFGYVLLTPGATYLITVEGSGTTILAAQLPW